MNQLKSEGTSHSSVSSPSPISKIAILGIGGSGVKIASIILESNLIPNIKVGVLDFDDQSLSSFPGKHKISSQPPTHSGPAMGTGGDLIVGERLTAMARPKITDFLEGSDLLIGISGVGGGTGTSASPIVARVATNQKIPSVFILTVPFSFEGHKRRQTAEIGIKNLITDADVVIPIDNDILFSNMSSDIALPDAFLMSDREIANCSLDIAELFLAKSYLSSAFPSLKNMLAKRNASCAIGSAEIEIKKTQDVSVELTEKLLDSPLLGGFVEIKKADSAIIIISAGPEIGIGIVKKTFERLKHFFRPDTELICVVSDTPLRESKLRATVLTARYQIAKCGIEPFTEYDGKNSDHIYTQDELPLMTPKKGIFTNTSENFYKNQDIDIPTFQRKGINIDPGR